MMNLLKGYVSIILHAHLPYVHHPEKSGCLEERWLFEAISESYIPLLNVFEKLILEGVDFKIAMSVTPPLISMLSAPLLQARYIKYLEKTIELCEKELERTKDQPAFHKLAKFYYEKYKSDYFIFTDKYKCNIIKGFIDIQKAGYLEILASAATHAFLPLMEVTPESINAQITMGVKFYESTFGTKPKGMWLPECGYTPVMDKYLKNNGIEYILLESHGLLYADPRPVFGTYAPIVTPNGIVAFGRDFESSNQVWSAVSGYPGDFDYRDFYRDIGYDLDYDYIKDFISPDGSRIQTGIKYYRITSKSDYKEPYNIEWAQNKANLHAGHFLYSRQNQIEHIYRQMGRPPVIVCPYDAELFGHWWYEGPIWLYNILKKTDKEQENFKLTTPGEYIRINPVMQVSTPCSSSWGINGYNEMWLNHTNDWIYRPLHKASRRMAELANENLHADGIKKQALNQAARELMLAQSSDWAFIMKNGTFVQYAHKRTKDHIARFSKLYHDIKEDNIDKDWLIYIGYIDNIFPEMDYRIYANSQ